MTEAEFYQAAEEFLNHLFVELETNKIELESHWDIDHLCYRTDTLENYNQLKNLFKTFGKLLIASDVNGREISTYELFKPVIHREWRIDLIELPAPKAGKITVNGFEHVEVVCDVPFEKLIEKYQRLNLDTNGLNKSFNKELEVCLGANNLKFHQLSLLSVINVEKNTKVWNAILNSKILEIFAKNQPLIAGTFPLNVEVETSDVDILLQSTELEAVKLTLNNHFGACQEFSQHTKVIDDLDSLVCHFVFNDVPFEVFVQNKEPVRQTAYLHFLVEERLLKLGGKDFKDKVAEERGKGSKTELAFTTVLGLTEDPFRALLKLQGMTASELCGRLI